MTVSIKAAPSGTSGVIQVGGVDVLKFGAGAAGDALEAAKKPDIASGISSALVALAAGAIGSTIMAARITASTTTAVRLDFGDVVAGSDLRPVGMFGTGVSTIAALPGVAAIFGPTSVTNTTLAGTWLCVSTEGASNASRITVSLWRRIA